MVTWSKLCALIEPVYPQGTSSEGGRPVVPLERMLRIYFLQLWFNRKRYLMASSAVNSSSLAAIRLRERHVAVGFMVIFAVDTSRRRIGCKRGAIANVRYAVDAATLTTG